MKKTKEENKLRVQQMKPIKFKDKPNRSRIYLNLKEMFGFIPEFMIVDKIPGQSNTIQISAVLPDDMVKRLDEEEKSNKLKGKVNGNNKPN